MWGMNSRARAEYHTRNYPKLMRSVMSEIVQEKALEASRRSRWSLQTNNHQKDAVNDRNMWKNEEITVNKRLKDTLNDSYRVKSNSVQK